MFQINIPNDTTYNTKFIANGYLNKVSIHKKGKTLWLSFPFNRTVMDEIKNLEGCKWHGYEDPPIKQWSISDTPANWFQIAFLEGKNPYKWWEQPLKDVKPSREIYEHQVELFRAGITYRYHIFAAEPGTGKTLAAIEVIEYINDSNVIWVGPKSALYSVKLEFEKWKARIWPKFLTYEGLKKFVENEFNIPRVVVFDESSRCKNPTSQRSQAGAILADAVRDKYGWEGCVIEMSGTPAPKSPADWFHQAKIACPGFLKECNFIKFKERLAVIGKGENAIGGIFPKLITWRDDESKCKICGLLKDDPSHDVTYSIEKDWHPWTPGINEVAKLYKRMSGLVTVKLKKDCLSLPEKQFKTIKCKPNYNVINAAKLLVAKGSTAIKTLTLMRELSDGFQYEEEAIGEETCPLCKGKRTQLDWVYIGSEEKWEEASVNIALGDCWKQEERSCNACSGTGKVTSYTRVPTQVACPKEDVLKDLLDEYEEVGRLVIYAGFTGSVDRCCEIAKQAGWNFIRVDGRGWTSDLPGKPEELLKIFQNKNYELNQKLGIAFIGQPGAAGMGLTLTAACAIVYYSNDFNAESRAQSMDRIHRPGMDKNRGATIIDIVHLPTDQLVIDNLNKKKKLQGLTMGELSLVMNNPLIEMVR